MPRHAAAVVVAVAREMAVAGAVAGHVARRVAESLLAPDARMEHGRGRTRHLPVHVAAQREATVEQPEPAPEAKPRDDGVAIRRAAVTARRHAQCAGKALVR